MARDTRPRVQLLELIFLVPTFLIAFALLTVLLSPLQPPVPVTRDYPKLEFKRPNVFTLAIFSDLHYGEEEHGWGIDQDINSTRVMNAVLDLEDSIDLVVLNGDLITGENTFKENSSAYVDHIVTPMVVRNIPWASTYGNHDSKFNLSREAIFQAEKKYPLSYTQQMDTTLPGVTNYYLILQTNDGRPVALLWFFDSRGGASYQQDPLNEDDIPNWVADETAQWFVTTNQQIGIQYGRLPSIAFVHIPPHPYLVTQMAGLDPTRFPGINDDVPVSIQGRGQDDDAFVDALTQDALLHSVYVGHDHGSAWCGTWPSDPAIGRPRRRKPHGDDDYSEHGGPFLCFSRHTGYGGYGTWDRGARIVQLSFEGFNDDGSFSNEGELRVDTWVRMENGEIITRVTLNETYGLDTYT